MANIIEETFQDGLDKGLALRNEEFGRKLLIGTDWTILYVGIMVSVQPSGSANISNASLRIGMSPSIYDHVGNAIPQMWYGMQLGDNAGNINGSTFTYQGGTANPVYTSGGVVRMRIITGSFSAGFNAGGPTVPAHTGSVLRKWPVVTRFEKTGSNINVTVYTFNNYTTPSNTEKYFSTQDFLNGMDDVAPSGTPSFSGSSTTFQGVTTFAYTAFTSSYGELDTIHVGWNKTSQDLRIWDIVVSRKA